MQKIPCAACRINRARVLALALAAVLPVRLWAQESTQAMMYAVPVTTRVQESPPQVIFEWPTNAAVTSYTIYRKPLSSSAWGSAIFNISAGAGACTGFTDTNVAVGTLYDYRIERMPYSGGYGQVPQTMVCAGIRAPFKDSRGKLVLLVDNTMSGPLSGELARLEQDLVGDGWIVLRHDVSRSATVPSIRSIIQSDYFADTNNVNTVFLFGHIPVPYSGRMYPDAHGDHIGAWPADGYYGDMDGTWTDTRVNDTTSADSRNHNIPGDGKFDQGDNGAGGISYNYGGPFESAVELGVGRVDLSALTYFSKSETELLRQYLEKDHNWRHKRVTGRQRGLVDDNFAHSGYSSVDEMNTYRIFWGLFGADRVDAVDLVSTLLKEDYLWVSGSGPGHPATCEGAITTYDMANNDLKGWFFQLGGSYFTDWDVPNDILRAVLAMPTHGLSCVGNVRPNWAFHPMGMGETLGYCTRLSENYAKSVYNTFYHPSYSQGLMGDPTLRMHAVYPASDLAAAATTSGVDLAWSASPEPSIEGYHVYRSANALGPFARLTAACVTNTAYADLGAPLGVTNYYMVRVVKLETPVVGGSYSNASQGIFVKSTGAVDLQAPTAPSGLAVRLRTDRSVTLAWNPSSDNVGVARYLIFMNGAQAGLSATTNFTRAGLAPETAYNCHVRAQDAAGNLSDESGQVVATTLPSDFTPPTPPGAPVLASNTVTSISIKWSASTDNVAVERYWIYSGGVYVGASASTNFTHLAIGPNATNVYRVRAVDASGNLSGLSAASAALATAAWSLNSQLQFWVKADAGVATNSQGRVSYWYDQSGNARDARSSGLAQPLLVGNVLNGRPVIRLDGLSNCFDVTTSAMLANVPGCTIVAVYKYGGTWSGGQRVMFYLARSSPSQPRVSLGVIPEQGGRINAVRFDAETPVYYAHAHSIINGEFFTQTATMDYLGGNILCHKNGRGVAQTAFPSKGMGDANGIPGGMIGADYYRTASTMFNGDIAEIMVYSGALEAPVRQAVENYLASKYGLPGPASAIPAPPESLTAAAFSSSRIDLTWEDHAWNETGFRIERKTDGGSYEEVALAGANVTSCSDTGLAATTHYYYRMRTANAAGFSEYSNESDAFTLQPTANPPPAVAITNPAANATFTAGTNITIKAAASDSGTGSVVKVEFYAGTGIAGEANGAPWNCVWTDVPAGQFDLSAVATDDEGAMTTSAAVRIYINAPGNPPPSVAIVNPSNNAVLAWPTNVTIVATATDSGTGTVTSVVFYSGATNLGTDTSAPYSCVWSNLAVGQYEVMAVATDNEGATMPSALVRFSVSIPSNPPPSVTITSPATNATFMAGTNVTIAAAATDNVSVVTVGFYAGTTAVGSDSGAPWSCVWANVAAGGYDLTAVATDNDGAMATSAVVHIQVNAQSSGVTNGLVGYWPLDENGGTTANDASGKGYHGTLAGMNAPVWTAPGKVGASSLLFNIQSFSNPSRVDLPAGLDALATNAGFSISAWCKPNAAPGGSYCKTTVLAGQTPNNDTGGNVLGYYYNASGDYRFNMRFCHTAAGTAAVAMSPAHSPVGEWYHVVGVVNRTAGTVKVYTNGVLSATTAFTPGTAAYALWPTYHWKLGAWGGNRDDTNYGRQTLDEVRMYNRVLSDGEVLELAGITPPDTQAPTLSVLTPANLSYTTNIQVDVAGTAADASGVASVTVNGAAASTMNGFANWNRTVTGLAVGTNVVTVVAMDTPGNAATNLVRVIYATGSFDGNGDGLPDAWQIGHFGFGFATNTNATPDADADHDGMSNADEYRAGTDPNDGLDRLALSAIRYDPGANAFTVEWRSVSGRVYLVQWNTNLLSSGWLPVDPVVAASSNWARWTDNQAGASTSKFYRVTTME